MPALEARLQNLDTSDLHVIDAAIEEYAAPVSLEHYSLAADNKRNLIDRYSSLIDCVL